MTFEDAVQTIQPGRYRHFKGNEYEMGYTVKSIGGISGYKGEVER